MTMFALTGLGNLERRESTARRALKTWSYRLVRGKDSQQPRYAIVDLKSERLVFGKSVEVPNATLTEVEEWFNAQRFIERMSPDGVLLRDVSRETMTERQREVLDRIASLPDSERIELIRFLGARLMAAKYASVS